jgi:mannose-1-phosphate guanylyltransferase
MRKPSKQSGQVWSIILTGGDDTNVNPFVSRWLGRPMPKEYCAFVGARSMFQHTLDRAVQITPAERVVAVVAREHRQEAFRQLDRRTIGALILQSLHQRTAASVFLPLTYVRERDPEATVVVLPSDHFVYPEARFLALVQQAIALSHSLSDQVMVFGVAPDRLQLDYGWIQPSPRLAHIQDHAGVRAVQNLAEKPTPAQADRLLQAGALWNTRTFVAKASTIWEIGWKTMPHFMPYFERLGQAIGCPNESLELETIYKKVSAVDFSDILRQVADRLAVLELTGVLWSDWNKPERIAETLRRIDRQPAFPLTCLDHPFVPLTRPATEIKTGSDGPSIGEEINVLAEQALQKAGAEVAPRSSVRPLRGVAAGGGQRRSAGCDLEASL